MRQADVPGRVAAHRMAAQKHAIDVDRKPLAGVAQRAAARRRARGPSTRTSADARGSTAGRSRCSRAASPGRSACWAVGLIVAGPPVDLLQRRRAAAVQRDDARIAPIRIVLRRQLHPVLDLRIFRQAASPSARTDPGIAGVLHRLQLGAAGRLGGGVAFRARRFCCSLCSGRRQRAAGRAAFEQMPRRLSAAHVAVVGVCISRPAWPTCGALAAALAGQCPARAPDRPDRLGRGRRRPLRAAASCGR